MKKLNRLILILIMISAWNCQNERISKSIEGDIYGLKKGTVYLNLFRGDSLIPVDSLRLKGTGHFVFKTDTVSPQLAVITVKELPDAYLMFFIDDTLMKISTELKKMGLKKRIEGGINHRYWEAYQNMVKQMNDKRLDVIKQKWEAAKNNDSVRLKEAEDQLISIEKRFKYFAYHFAAKHAQWPVGAYVAWENFRNNQTVLDSLYHRFSPEVRRSVYGKYIAGKINK